MSKIKIFFISLLIISLFSLTGCIDYVIKTEVKENGSGSRSIDLAIDKSFAKVMETAPSGGESKNIEEEMKDALPEGGKFRKYEKGDKSHYQITFDFKDIDDLKKKNEKFAGSEDGLSFKNTKLVKRDYIVFATYKFSEEIESTQASSEANSPQAEQLTQSFSLKYQLSLPGEITKTENKGKIDKDTAAWELSFTEGGKISATSQIVRWYIIIALAVVLFIIFLIILILFFLFIRSRRKKAAGAGVESAT